jgi:hypothetical protein
MFHAFEGVLVRMPGEVAALGLGALRRFLLRQLSGERTEMALVVQTYNLKRAINVLGARQMIALMN